jgi:hypothetical protein
MEVVRFTDGACCHEVWKLPDRGWDDWSACVDQFLAHAIGGIAAEYVRESVEWLEINHWPYSGRLIVFPSREGPPGDRHERVCFELTSQHLEAAFQQVDESVSGAERETVWVALSRRVWLLVSECLQSGASGQELVAARRRHLFRVAGYDYNPGEGLWWLTETGAFRG